jgi:hypothetical protein
MDVGYHCEEENEGAQGTDPRRSVDYKESMKSEDSVYCKEDLDYKGNHKEMGVIEGILSIPPFDFDFGLGLNLGFDKPPSRDTVSQSIVV